VLSSGGLLQGMVGSDEAFALTLAAGIAVIYAGFAVASGARPSIATGDTSPGEHADQASGDNARRNNLPANDRGSSSTSSTRVGSL